MRETHDYTPYNLANMYETMVRYDSVATVTNIVRGEKTIRVQGTGYQKKGCTVALTITASTAGTCHIQGANRCNRSASEAPFDDSS